MARSTLAGLILFLGSLYAQQPQIKQAGVCSRCHVAQVLEWSVATKHGNAGTTCQSCHGPSAGHVANERNQVKPDRLPANPAQFAALCSTCHTAGCPKTAKKDDCQSCHHPHALSNPNDKALRQNAAIESPALQTYKTQMAEGERLLAIRDWTQALAAFNAAAAARPGDKRAGQRAKIAERRLRPGLPGLDPIGDAFDPASGLPLRVRVPVLNVEMLLVLAGESDIGSDALPASRPVHSVYTEPFYLARYELTQKQWLAINAENPSPIKGDKLPVHGVSWNDARAWIAKLNARTGGAFRLPTEAEWERAATPAQGDLTTAAWFRDNSAIPGANAGFKEMNAYAPHNVGSKQANALGFFDMLGNVAEWCSSPWRPYPYSTREDAAPDSLRIVRGGAYGDSPEYLNPAFRHSERPTRRSPWVGFRLAY